MGHHSSCRRLFPFLRPPKTPISASLTCDCDNSKPSSASLAPLPGSPLHRCASCVPLRKPKQQQLAGRPPPAGSRSRLESKYVVTIEPSTTPSRIAAATAGSGRAPAVREILFVACVGSALDLDHFLAAGSLRLSRATSLGERPWGHSVVALFLAVRGGF